MKIIQPKINEKAEFVPNFSEYFGVTSLIEN